MDSYDLLSEIGKGMGGIVYLARDKQSGEFKAVKQVGIDERRPTRKREALLREANILSALSHPHIVKCHDFFFLEPHHLCIVQEYCDGGTLADQILSAKETSVPISEPLIWKWLLQILLALHYLHNEKQVIHRDLKAANVFLVKGRTVKVGDFGIAKMLENDDLATSTCVGTPCYLSPELVQDIPYTTQSDMWSLGCLLYELISLRRPFDANNLLALFTKISRAEVSHPLDPDMRYSEALHRIVDGLLQPDPLQRFSAGQLLKDPNVMNRLGEFIEEKERLIQLGRRNKAGSGGGGGGGESKCSRVSDKSGSDLGDFNKELSSDVKNPMTKEDPTEIEAWAKNRFSSSGGREDERRNDDDDSSKARGGRNGDNDDTNHNALNQKLDSNDHCSVGGMDLVLFGEKIFCREDGIKVESLEGVSYEDDFEEQEEEQDEENEEEREYSDDYEEEEVEEFGGGDDDKGYEDDFDEFDSSDEEVLTNAKNIRGVYCGGGEDLRGGANSVASQPSPASERATPECEFVYSSDSVSPGLNESLAKDFEILLALR